MCLKNDADFYSEIFKSQSGVLLMRNVARNTTGHAELYMQSLSDDFAVNLMGLR